MPLSSQKQVMAGNEKLAGRGLGRASADYRREVVAPLVAGISRAKSLRGLLAQLGGGLVRRMKTPRFETTLAETMTQAEVNGIVSATPREKKRRKG